MILQISTLNHKHAQCKSILLQNGARPTVYTIIKTIYQRAVNFTFLIASI